jgi:cytochrome oxidase Cu insertion factor (SCO1/SenC/PrrC family)
MDLKPINAPLVVLQLACLLIASPLTANSQSRDGRTPSSTPARPEVKKKADVHEHLQQTGKKPTDGEAAKASATYFPNHILLTQDNKPVRFYDDLLKGKVVLINFMFTTCTGVCPPMTANLAKVQNLLGERVGKDVVMISISVDPTVDAPDVLRKYADSFKAKPGWYFLTGKKENVDWVLYKLGGYVEDKTEHSAVLIIGNEATGEWVKTYALRNPGQIAEAVIGLLDSNKKGK